MAHPLAHLGIRMAQRRYRKVRSPFPARYSVRSAVIGSTLDACHAGMAQAAPATKISTAIPASRMTGSRELPSAHFASIECIAKVRARPGGYACDVADGGGAITAAHYYT